MSLPTGTYRIQFRNGFDFAAAERIVPYLARLGVSHLYASPVFTAVTGSTHGYDVTDHCEIDPALGGMEGFARLCAALKRARMGLLLDIVPNHMAASMENAWWRDVATWGKQSRFANHFDIDWTRRLTLPILGRPFEEAAREGELTLVPQSGLTGQAIDYFGTAIPLHPASYEPVLARLQHPLAGEITALAGRASPEDGAAFGNAVSALLQGGDADGLAREMRELSRDADFLRFVHEQQPWELTFWKDARHSLSYRRFFEVTGLVGVRVEDETVFRDVHRLTLQLLRDGLIDGLRIDHVDGLADPGAYLRRLRQEIGPETYLVVEKILNGEEALPSDWPVDGTTGYEFIDATIDLLADADGREALSFAYEETTGAGPIEEARTAAKRQVLRHNFAGELDNLARLVAEVDIGSGHDEDAVREALVGLLVAMPVYRTYVGHGAAGKIDHDILQAASGANATAASFHVFSILAGTHAQARSETARLARQRFEQLCGPAMAKGVEDTLFYRDHRLLALNEVGCEPDRPAPAPSRFHRRMEARAAAGDHSLNTTSTHDTKRGEDGRARLMALTEAPDDWARALARWSEHLAGKADGAPGPSPATAWMIFQALAGAWPEAGWRGQLDGLRGRFGAYVEKALREAKQETSWTEPDEAHEAMVQAHAARLLADTDLMEDFDRTLAPYVAAGHANSMAQTLAKLTAPGIPDIYQGSECGDFSLVDPDNRRAVDYDQLADMPERVGALGASKQHLIARGLTLRGRLPALFSEGKYLPLAVSEKASRHLVAFARHHEGTFSVSAMPRLTMSLPEEAWQGVEIGLPPEWTVAQLRDELGACEPAPANRIAVAPLLESFPVVLLSGRLEG